MVAVSLAFDRRQHAAPRSVAQTATVFADPKIIPEFDRAFTIYSLSPVINALHARLSRTPKGSPWTICSPIF